jgi:hypothetical protein
MFSPKIHHIHLKDIDDAAYVQRYCRREKIYYTVYIIRWQCEVLKYGIQHRIGSNQPGERIYTQIGWMPGWSNGTLKRCKSTGEAIQKVIAYVEQKYKMPFHKDNVSVEIMDYTNYPFVNKNIYAEMQNLEEHFKKLHFDCYGHYPIGNPKQEKIRHIPTQYNTLFD